MYWTENFWKRFNFLDEKLKKFFYADRITSNKRP